MKLKKIKTTEKIHNGLNDLANAMIFALTGIAALDVAGFSLAELFTSKEKKIVVICVGLFKFVAKMTEPKSVTPPPL